MPPYNQKNWFFQGTGILKVRLENNLSEKIYRKDRESQSLWKFFFFKNKGNLKG